MAIYAILTERRLSLRQDTDMGTPRFGHPPRGSITPEGLSTGRIEG